MPRKKVTRKEIQNLLGPDLQQRIEKRKEKRELKNKKTKLWIERESLIAETSTSANDFITGIKRNEHYRPPQLTSPKNTP